MLDEQSEQWQQRIREFAPKIRDAKIAVFRSEADVKKLQAQLELAAMANGAKAISMQKTIADNDDSLYQARLAVGVAKGTLSGLEIALKAVEVGFDEWRTRMASAREEKKRYGA